MTSNGKHVLKRLASIFSAMPPGTLMYGDVTAGELAQMLRSVVPGEPCDEEQQLAIDYALGMFDGLKATMYEQAPGDVDDDRVLCELERALLTAEPGGAEV